MNSGHADAIHATLRSEHPQPFARTGLSHGALPKFSGLRNSQTEVSWAVGLKVQPQQFELEEVPATGSHSSGAATFAI